MTRSFSRRAFLKNSAFLGAYIPSYALSFPVNPNQDISKNNPDIGYYIQAQAHGLVPNSLDDQSATFQKLLNLSSKQDTPLFLPSGVYRVGGITLPRRTRLIGVAGSTRLSFNGRKFLMRSDRADITHIQGIVFDGLGLPLSQRGQGLLSLNIVRDLKIDRCEFVASGLHGVDITGASGFIGHCSFFDIGDTAIFSKQSNGGMTITDNDIERCGNGGILVHRFTKGDDGSVIRANRVKNIRAVNGGTGQWGNAINVFQAHNVSISNNHITQAAFSAIRANAAHNIQILGNHCRGSGETALYGEFSYEGAAIHNNLIDGGTIGISLANFNEGGRLATVTGNLIRNLSDALPYENKGNFKPGIGIYAEADTTLSANIIENVPQAGIHVGWGEFCRDVIVAQNIVRQAPWGITASVVRGAKNVIIRNNVLSQISKQAITGFKWARPETGELLGKRKSEYNHLTISGNRLS